MFEKDEFLVVLERDEFLVVTAGGSKTVIIFAGYIRQKYIL